MSASDRDEVATQAFDGAGRALQGALGITPMQSRKNMRAMTAALRHLPALVEMQRKRAAEPRRGPRPADQAKARERLHDNTHAKQERGH